MHFVDISNFDDKLLEAMEIASELTTAWDSSDNSEREILQNPMFPEGIYYDVKKTDFELRKSRTSLS